MRPRHSFYIHSTPKFIVPSTPTTPNFTADVWQTFEFSTPSDNGGWSSSLMSNDNNATAQWTSSTSNAQLITTSSAERPVLSTINSMVDTGSLGLRRTFTTNSAANLQLTLPADSASLSIGFWFKYSASLDFGVNHPLMVGQDNAGHDSFDQMMIRYSTKYIGWGSSGNSNGSALVNNSWYWITAQYVQNSTSSLRVYDSTGAQFGSEATTVSVNYPVRKLFPFNYNPQSPDGTLEISMDDFVVNYTTAQFPLGP